MNYENTDLYFLRRDCLLRFGEEDGEKIFLRSSKLYAELVVTTEYRNGAENESRLKKLVFPVIAYYKTLRFYGYGEGAALGLVRNETEKAAKECAAALKNQIRRVFPFHAFKRNIRRFIAYKFPAPACVCGNLNVRGGKISFSVQECLYFTITGKFGCPELCKVFCEYEKIAFAGLAPAIVCERGGILSEGSEACDFTFFKGNKNK